MSNHVMSRLSKVEQYEQQAIQCMNSSHAAAYFDEITSGLAYGYTSNLAYTW